MEFGKESERIMDKKVERNGMIIRNWSRIGRNGKSLWRACTLDKDEKINGDKCIVAEKKKRKERNLYETCAPATLLNEFKCWRMKDRDVNKLSPKESPRQMGVGKIR